MIETWFDNSSTGDSSTPIVHEPEMEIIKTARTPQDHECSRTNQVHVKFEEYNSIIIRRSYLLTSDWIHFRTRAPEQFLSSNCLLM